MGLHTGEPISANEGYVGIDVHMAARICAAGHGGQVLVSQMSHDLIGSDLPSDVSLIDLGEHRLKDIIGLQRLYQVAADGLSREFGPLRTSGGRPSNLPRELTSFVGRDRQLADAGAILRVSPLLTLVGPGGVGKSRLGLRLAADHLDDYDEGAWLVELGTVVDADLVLETIATTLGVVQQPVATCPPPCWTISGAAPGCSSSTAASTSSVPRRRPSAGILAACPGVRILATSREGLGVAGEALYPVPSMSLPETERQVTAAELERSEAVRCSRPGRGRPARLPGHRRQRAAIAQLCRRLDGIPLALELAAARTQALSVDQIAARLDDQFRLLTGGSREPGRASRPCAPRMDWSFDLLSEPERAVLLRLAVLRRQPVARGRRARSVPRTRSSRPTSSTSCHGSSRSPSSWPSRPATAATGCSRRSACTPAIG